MFKDDRIARMKKKKLEQMESTVKTLLWAHRKLSIYVVEDTAMHFIIDSDFSHYVEIEKTVAFVKKSYDKLKDTDWFGLSSLGDQSFTIKLE